MNKKIISKEKDVIGTAIINHLDNSDNTDIIVHSEGFDDDVMSPGVFFRSYDLMAQTEIAALNETKGKILDVGAAAGCHSLWLQKQGLNVTPIEISPYSCLAMEKQGIKNIKNENFFNLNEKYDTILFLMNGIGICEKLENLEDLLNFSKEILNENGQIIFDSSDLRYLFELDDGTFEIDIGGNYYGEVNYTLEYKDIKGDKFDWVYIDPDNVKYHAEKNGFIFNILHKDGHFGYSAVLKKK